MALYEVSTTEQTGWKYAVNADSEEEAKQKVLAGEAFDSENMGSDSVEIIDVELLEPTEEGNPE